MGFCETGFGETEFGETGFCEMGFGETGFCEMGFGETEFCETGFGEMGFCETGFGETGFGETGGNRISGFTPVYLGSHLYIWVHICISRFTPVYLLVLSISIIYIVLFNYSYFLSWGCLSVFMVNLSRDFLKSLKLNQFLQAGRSCVSVPVCLCIWSRAFMLMEWKAPAKTGEGISIFQSTTYIHHTYIQSTTYSPICNILSDEINSSVP